MAAARPAGSAASWATTLASTPRVKPKVRRERPQVALVAGHEQEGAPAAGQGLGQSAAEARGGAHDDRGHRPSLTESSDR